MQQGKRHSSESSVLSQHVVYASEFMPTRHDRPHVRSMQVDSGTNMALVRSVHNKRLHKSKSANCEIQVAKKGASMPGEYHGMLHSRAVNTSGTRLDIRGSITQHHCRQK